MHIDLIIQNSEKVTHVPLAMRKYVRKHMNMDRLCLYLAKQCLHFDWYSQIIFQRTMKEQKDNLLDFARKRLQENYQEAQNGNDFMTYCFMFLLLCAMDIEACIVGLIYHYV